MWRGQSVPSNRCILTPWRGAQAVFRIWLEHFPKRYTSTQREQVSLHRHTRWRVVLVKRTAFQASCFFGFLTTDT